MAVQTTENPILRDERQTLKMQQDKPSSPALKPRAQVYRPSTAIANEFEELLFGKSESLQEEFFELFPV